VEPKAGFWLLWQWMIKMVPGCGICDLQPGPKYLPVQRYLPPEEFEYLGKAARSLGFRQVASGPFVRSSYHARDMADGL